MAEERHNGEGLGVLPGFRSAAALSLRAALALGGGLLALASVIALLDHDQGPSDALAGLGLLAGIVMATLAGVGYLRAFAWSVYRIDGSPPRRLLSPRLLLVAVVGVSMLLAGIVAALVLTGSTGPDVPKALGRGDGAAVLWTLGEWLAVAGIFGAAFMVLYWVVVRPDPVELRSLSGSRAVAAGLWTLAVGGSTFYLANFDSFSDTFGSLGASAVSILWLLLFSVLYYATPTLQVDRFGAILPGLGLALAGCLAASVGLATYASVLDPIGSLPAAVGLAAVMLVWLYIVNLAILSGVGLNLGLRRRLGLIAVPTGMPAETPAMETPPTQTGLERNRPMTSDPDRNELERIVRIALEDDNAHRGMWSALPGGPDEVPALLTELECDLNDWGFAYGVAWAVAKSRYPDEPDGLVAERALGAARAVFGEYCAGEGWPERLAARPLAQDAGVTR